MFNKTIDELVDIAMTQYNTQFASIANFEGACHGSTHANISIKEFNSVLSELSSVAQKLLKICDTKGDKIWKYFSCITKIETDDRCNELTIYAEVDDYYGSHCSTSYHYISARDCVALGINIADLFKLADEKIALRDFICNVNKAERIVATNIKKDIIARLAASIEKDNA